MLRRIIPLLLAISMLFALTGCAQPAASTQTTPPIETTAPAPTTAPVTTPPATAAPETAAPPQTTTDRGGYEIKAPLSSNRIAALAPNLCEIIIGLGKGSSIVGIEAYSTDIEGIPSDAAIFDMVAPDAEQLLALNPDILLISGLSELAIQDLSATLKDTGICIAYIPSSESIDGIYGDIMFIAELLGESQNGAELVDAMRREFDKVAAIAQTIPEGERKTVLFEISAAPYIYSFGTGTFLNELLEIAGAVNVLGSETGWVAVSEEIAVTSNPDVILTSVYYIDDPVGEILSRPGFQEVTAVVNEDVFFIDANSSNRASQFITKALWEIAAAVYPQYYQIP